MPNQENLDRDTLEQIEAARPEALFEWLEAKLVVYRAAQDEVKELKAQGKKKFRKGLRANALEAPHFERLIQRIRSEPQEKQVKIAQLRVASQIAHDAESAARKARYERDRELLVLHSRYGYDKKDLYGPYDIVRAKLNRSFRRLAGNVADKSEEAAKRGADRYHAKFLKETAAEATALQYRNDLLAELERPGTVTDDKEFHGGYRPAELGRLTGLTPARITQIRTGSTNAARARRARERRLAKLREAELGAGDGLEKIGA